MVPLVVARFALGGAAPESFNVDSGASKPKSNRDGDLVIGWRFNKGEAVAWGGDGTARPQNGQA